MGNIIAKFFVPYILIATLTRLVLFYYAYNNSQIDLTQLPYVEILYCGLINDLGTFAYIATIIALSCLCLYHLTLYKPGFAWITSAFIYFIWIYILLFNGVAEYLFWDEFGARFNFIAVDYLVYTREVIGNIKESYPLTIILIAILLVSLIIYKLLYPLQNRVAGSIIAGQYLGLIKAAGLYVFFGLLSYQYFSPINELSSNRYVNELAGNGIYNLFSAFRQNHLKYDSFYKTIDNREAFNIIKKVIKEPDQEYFDHDNEYDIARITTGREQPALYNVIVLSVESLSASYLEKFGGDQGLTPNLNKLIPNSLVFTRYYATGTRTVRGLEAMTLSVPPTPGGSIVRRSYNNNLFSINTILRDHNYDSKFIYGGYGYFDNMNDFFSSNGFTTIDRSDIPQTHINFANIWGVCDEDLYTQVLYEADKSFARGKPFFSLVMTTSNHRPYTYPKNKIDIPSGTSRLGAVKYADFAIGKFIKEAKEKPWFKNTIFVITADHCASSAGKTHITVNKYHIPLIIFAPGLIKPQYIDSLASQIDLAPTILGLLNISYVSRFFGNNLLKTEPDRALLATYQQLALMTNNKLVRRIPVR